MKREQTAVPRPRSAFVLIQCPSCGNEQAVFSHTTVDVKCKVCDTALAEKTGGRARLLGTLLKRLD